MFIAVKNHSLSPFSWSCLGSWQYCDWPQLLILFQGKFRVYLSCLQFAASCALAISMNTSEGIVTPFSGKTFLSLELIHLCMTWSPVFSLNLLQDPQCMYCLQCQFYDVLIHCHSFAGPLCLHLWLCMFLQQGNIQWINLNLCLMFAFFLLFSLWRN